VLLRELRAEWPELRVVMLTMHTERVYAEEAMGSGAAGYLLKSSGSAELRFAVEEAMAGRRYVTPLLGPAPAGAAPTAPTALPPQPVPPQDPAPRRVRTSRPQALAMTLTERQREVLTLLAHGYSTAEIAARLGISAKTVEFHRHAIRQELGVTSQAALVRFAVAAGLVEP
jgi:DNA-binding NarL/FixJ family response regulator